MFGQMEVLIIILLAIFLMYFNFARTRRNKGKQFRLMSCPDLLFNDGRVAYLKKRYRDAIRMLKQSALIRPELAKTHFYLGLSYAALGAFTEAEKAYQEALRR